MDPRSDQWLKDCAKVVCATIAFVIGIEKPDVHYAIDYSLPKSIHNHYVALPVDCY
ncbi:Bloom syndrome protein -like protein, partial [Caligus rogercresseyi]